MGSTAIVWYRRDLRTCDHPALHSACEGYDRVIPVFILDERLLDGRFASGPRTAFMLESLRVLDERLRELGGRLFVRRGRPEEVLVELAAEAGAEAVHWTSDVSPFALGRDRAVTEALAAAGVEAVPCPGNYCAAVSVPRPKKGTPVPGFTPFWTVRR
ncbi:MAG: deoxyribodipyrimidine photo-lyase, partial [Solirubrobacterales bacterium]